MASLCAILLFTSAAASSPDPYAWPLDLPRALTSSFGEFRGGRFHAGIDLRTGDIGKPVHAPADGYVSRVRCSPWGYGKVVYIQLADGRTAVLAHLDDFAPEIRDYVRAAQHERERYTVDLYPPRDVLPVRRGEIIARSGQTGIGVPHLHYELRDRQGRPISPRAVGVSWPDDTPPLIKGVLIVPDGPGSTVNDGIAPVVLAPSRQPDGSYACAPVHATGRIGFGLDTIDPANGGASKLGVRTVHTSTDTGEIFRVQIDRFSYENRRDEVVSYHPFMMEQGRYLLQWRWPGNVCEPFAQFDGDGWFDVPASDTEIRITVADFAGNEAAVVIPLRSGLPALPAEVAGGGNGTGRADMTCVGDWILVTAIFTQPEPAAPRLVFGSTETAFHRVDAVTFRAGLKPAEGAREAVLR
ncbi:MAG: peptidoglycan DD-metalloendopeptidase family protein, partial [Nitrospiraceae bacterium]|nr:peptidoglycan DD-metalloendopeptidase family protein [Nitrospiraceae bacterium]